MVKVVSFRTQQCLGPFFVLLLEGSFDPGLFRHLPSHLFRSPEFGKYIGYEGHLLFGNAQNLMWISKRQRKIKKKSFVSENKVSELVAINCLYYGENTGHRRSMC